MFRRFLRPSFALCSEFRRGDNQAVGYSILFPEACDSGAKDRSLFVHVSTSLLPFTFCPSHKCGHVGTSVDAIVRLLECARTRKRSISDHHGERIQRTHPGYF